MNCTNVTVSDYPSFPEMENETAPELPLFPTSESLDTSRWLISVSEFEPGASAIIGGNYVPFHIIHTTALTTIAVSFFTSIAVILKIYTNWISGRIKIDISLRFPLYLSILDATWSVCNFSGHFYLFYYQVIPAQTISEILGILMSLFFGATLITRAGIALYTYLNIVHGRKLDLGKWEWKSHLFQIVGAVTITPTLYYLGSFGFSGYWMAYDARTICGLFILIICGLFSSLNAICTTLGYYFIRRTVKRAQRNWSRYQQSAGIPIHSQKSRRCHSVALQCLTTYIWIGACFYFTLAISVWIYLSINVFCKAVEPITSFILVFVANSSGWVTAISYFYNERNKRKRRNVSGTSASITLNMTSSG